MKFLAEVGRERGVPVIQLYEQMRDPSVYFDAAHLNLDGMLRKGRLVAEGLVPVVRRARERAATDG